MARHGISYQEVANAAAGLVEEGKVPTHEQIRRVIGSGSNNTISKYLRQWKANQNINSLTAVKENIPDELTQILKNLWQRVVEQAEEKISEIEKNSIKQFSDLHLEYERYKNNNRRWQHLSQNWMKEKVELTEKIAQLEKKLADVEKENLQLFTKIEMFEQQVLDKQEQLKLYEKLFEKINIEAG